MTTPPLPSHGSSLPHSSMGTQSILDIQRCLASSPIIAAVRNMDDLAIALESPVQVISMMGGSIGEIADITARIHDHGKRVFFHPELVKGLGRDQAGIEYLARTATPDGIVSTKRHLLHTASQCGLISVLQIFMIDTQAFESGLDNIASHQPDAVEIMPGLMPRIVSCVKAVFSGPIFVAGLIKNTHDVDTLMKAGTSGVAVSEQSLWTYSPQGMTK